MKVLLITGSREECSAYQEIVTERLARIEGRDVVLIHGGATGVDYYAGIYAGMRGWVVWKMPYPPGLRVTGGPIRNAAMVAAAVAVRDRAGKTGAEFEGIAFPAPSSRGTWGCARQMQKAGFSVDVVELPPRPNKDKA